MFGLIFTLAAVALATICFYVKYSYSFWQRRGIPYLEPSLPFGNFGKFLKQKLPLGLHLAEMYRSTSEPFIGIFMLLRPLLLVRDPNLIRRILITNFQHFTDRDFYLNEKDDPLTDQIFALRGQRWRDTRSKLLVAFTPYKIKMLLSNMLDCGKQLQTHLSKVVDANEAIEMCEIIDCYATNAVGSTGFGIEVDCLADSNHPLRNKLLKWSGLRFVEREVEEYFLNLVAQVMEMRQHSNFMRKDYFQSLMELHDNNNANTLADTDEWASVTETSTPKPLSLKHVAAEAFNFYLAALAPVSLTTTFCLYEIAKHSDIQRKIHAEMDHVMAQHNGQLTYESVNELKYLDCCVQETVRKYPVIHLSRVCVQDYKIPGTNVTIEKGTSIVISTFGLHYDEKFYPDPHKFDPTRFSSESKADKSFYSDMPYLAFGDGPRTCLGQRLGKMFVKVAICSILQQYHIDLDDRHIGTEIKFAVNTHPLGGIHLKLKKK